MEVLHNNTAHCLSRGFETIRLWADIQLRVFQQWTDFSANATKEGVSLYAELQASTLETLQAEQAYTLHCLSRLPEAAHNPLYVVQQNLRETMECGEKIVKLWQNNAQAIFRSSEQYWLTAQQTERSMQASYTQLAAKLQALHFSL